MPSRFPAFPERDDIDAYGRMIPARQVGGDQDAEQESEVVFILTPRVAIDFEDFYAKPLPPPELSLPSGFPEAPERTSSN